MKWIKEIGIIDVLIVLIIFGAILYIVKPSSDTKNLTISSTPIIYTFESNEVGEEFIDQLEIGKDLFNSSKNFHLGKIKDFKVNPYREKFEDKEKGIITMVEHPGKYSVLIDIEADAVIENDVVMVDREEIRVDHYLPIRGKNFASYGYIVGVER